MRAAPLALLALAACSAGETQPLAEEGAEAVLCAIGPGSEFRADCRMERATVDGERHLVVRHPDGSFRRFLALSDGSGVSVVDGADVATQELDGDALVVTVAADRYRFPARRLPDPETPDSENGDGPAD